METWHIIGVKPSTKKEFNAFKRDNGFKSADKAVLYLLSLLREGESG